MKIGNPALAILACLLSAFAAGEAIAADEVTPAPAEPARRIGEIVQKLRAQTGADVSVHAVRTSDGTVLCDIDGDRAMIPASNQKILTSAVALKRLGADFAFRTRVAMCGEDLVVFADGDPTAGDERLAHAAGKDIYHALDRWAAAVKGAGIEKVPGNLVIRAGIFQPPMVHPDWPKDQLRRWYAAPAAGANINDNCFDIGFVVHDGSVAAKVSPASRFLRIDSKVSAGTRHVWSCRFDATGTQLALRGTAQRTTPSPYPVAMPDPPAVYACVFADRLARAGVTIAGTLVVDLAPRSPRRPGENDALIATETTPLAAAMGRANRESLNMMAECLFLRSAVEPDAPATWKSASAVAGKVLCQEYGLKDAGLVVSDGSGLSKSNRVSPAAICSLLSAMRDEAVFVDSLAVAARTGSLARRMHEANVRGRVLGKTGSLAGASALSGYVLDADGAPAVAFSVITNGRTYGKTFSAKDAEDCIAEALAACVDADGAAKTGVSAESKTE